MTKALVAEVRRRAAGRCEYCQMPDDFYRSPFQLDHIIARQHGGDTSHPRVDRWNQHFAWEEATLIGLSSSGRATIRALAINDPDSVAVRRALIEEGVFAIKPS